MSESKCREKRIQELVGIMRDMAAGKRNGVGDYWDRTWCNDAADAIVSLSAELARYREAPTVALLIDGRAEETLGSLQGFDTGRHELIVRPTEAK